MRNQQQDLPRRGKKVARQVVELGMMWHQRKMTQTEHTEEVVPRGWVMKSLKVRERNLLIPGGLDAVRGLSRRTRKNENKNNPKFLA